MLHLEILHHLLQLPIPNSWWVSLSQYSQFARTVPSAETTPFNYSTAAAKKTDSNKKKKRKKNCSPHHISVWLPRSEWTSVLLLSVSEPPGHHAPTEGPLYRGPAPHTAPGRVRRTGLPLETLSGANQTSHNDIYLRWQIPGINMSQQMTTTAGSCLKVFMPTVYNVHRGVLVPSGSSLQKRKSQARIQPNGFHIHFSFFSNSLSTTLANQPPITIPNSYFICANWAISVTDTGLICLEFNHQKQTRNTNFHFQDGINSNASLLPSLKPPSRLQHLQNSYFWSRTPHRAGVNLLRVQ